MFVPKRKWLETFSFLSIRPIESNLGNTYVPFTMFGPLMILYGSKLFDPLPIALKLWLALEQHFGSIFEHSRSTYFPQPILRPFISRPRNWQIYCSRKKSSRTFYTQSSFQWDALRSLLLNCCIPWLCPEVTLFFFESSHYDWCVW